MYLKDLEASVRVPICQLAGFRRVHLNPGESTEVCFTVTPRQMALIRDNGECILEPGKFRIFVGGSQPDARSTELTGMKVMSAEFFVTGNPLKLQR